MIFFPLKSILGWVKLKYARVWPFWMIFVLTSDAAGNTSDIEAHTSQLELIGKKVAPEEESFR